MEICSSAYSTLVLVNFDSLLPCPRIKLIDVFSRVQNVSELLVQHQGVFDAEIEGEEFYVDLVYRVFLFAADHAPVTFSHGLKKPP